MEMTTERTSTASNCSNYYCISDEDYIDKLHDYIFPSTFEWIVVVLYAAVFFGGLAGNVDETLVSPLDQWRPGLGS